MQETFVRAVPRLDKLDPATADVGAYLFTTLRNLFLKQVERTKRQQPMAEVPEPVLPTPIEDDPERRTLLRRQQDEVRLANARLQPRQRLVLALRELEDRSYAEIGELVDMKENAVAQLIFRARESLRLELRLAQVDPERLPEECRRFLPLLAAHLDGQLKGARQQETLAHLEGCERCQAALAGMREASRRYRTIFLPGFLATTRRARRWSAASTPRTTGIAGAAGYWCYGRSGRSLRLRRSSCSAAAARPWVSPSPETATPHRSRRRRRTEAEFEAATNQEIVAPAPVPPTTTHKRSAPKPAPPKVTATTASTTAPVPSTEETVDTTPAPEVTAPEPKPKPVPKLNTDVTARLPDTTAPTVTITQAPGASVASSGAQIRFTSNEAGAKLACKLDAAAYSACTSPAVLSGSPPEPIASRSPRRTRPGTWGSPRTPSGGMSRSTGRLPA